MSDIEKHTEVVPEVIFLGKLVERVAAGRIRVPKFQRDFVWNQPDLSALLDSVRRGFSHRLDPRVGHGEGNPVHPAHRSVGNQSGFGRIGWGTCLTASSASLLLQERYG